MARSSPVVRQAIAVLLCALLAATPAGAAAARATQRLKALAAARLSLRDAIAAAQQKIEGRPFDSSFEVDAGRYVYTVDLATADGLVELVVDPGSGDSRPSAATPRLSEDVEVQLAILPEMRVALGDAIATAEHLLGGKALEASVSTDPRLVAYEIKVVKDRSYQTVIVDGRNGGIIGNDEDDDDDD